ncbi:MAG: SIS domain-containing protein [Phycisphaerae bacterium]|nr:SIS domain-containing protein [Phycisphaerae bacterium]
MSEDLNFTQAYLAELSRTLADYDPRSIADFISLLRVTRDEGKRIFIFGNGGAAAAASHFTCDLGKGASLGRPVRFQIQCLNDNIPWLTALSNDVDYADCFVEQLQNFASPGDVVIGVSASGNSLNVLKAVNWAGANECRAVGISGFDGGELRDISELFIHIPSSHMGQIEDGHCIVLHLVAYALMED